MLSRLRRGSFSFVMLLAVGCRGTLPVAWVEEHPTGSGAWRAIAAEPTWVQAPPANVGHLRIVAESRSNLRDIAVGNLDATARQALQDRVVQALRTVVPAPAASAAAAAAPATMRLVQRACRDEVLTHDPVPGNTLATVWGLYEVPVADLLAHVAAEHRTVAEAALAK